MLFVKRFQCVRILGDITEGLEFLRFALVLWSCYVFAEQQAMAVMMFVKNSLVAASVNIYLACIYIMLASGVLRSYRGYEEWLYYLTYVTQTRYVSIFLHRSVFKQSIFRHLPYSDKENCTSTTSPIQTAPNLISNSNANCRYSNGDDFLSERFGAKDFIGEIQTSSDFDLQFNMAIAFAFALGIMVINKFLYLMPLPAHVKDKFRE
ncbi:hypothetical protein EVAR_102881_1 [Eumeta japonica]|uniref:Uncharacterized protein n=1 Tax=Eumeta variegata TaxID=151549 RepID=A0A4C1UNI6_EUMVA|nr:hypothetical protein EVAR_102881_1 [Eumeta japonica]